MTPSRPSRKSISPEYDPEDIDVPRHSSRRAARQTPPRQQVAASSNADHQPVHQHTATRTRAQQDAHLPTASTPVSPSQSASGPSPLHETAVDHQLPSDGATVTLPSTTHQLHQSASTHCASTPTPPQASDERLEQILANLANTVAHLAALRQPPQSDDGERAEVIDAQSPSPQDNRGHVSTVQLHPSKCLCLMCYYRSYQGI